MLSQAKNAHSAKVYNKFTHSLLKCGIMNMVKKITKFTIPARPKKEKPAGRKEDLPWEPKYL